ncbi:hypothetical protein [Rubripirellula reticaptiva]|uniref:Uncharacterized protein n=1 Tax=Rubripirellula reticaptiva TaxID=2528013 RepID=A0A5C6EFL3_9BACT|nr:hypothetical protein [Rubripirellula reticaptiva]TWU46481.1 hypothetical protein Poly59_54240 [Rubripirellula reticaptiva]
MTYPLGSGSDDIPPPWHPFIPPFDPPGSSLPPAPPNVPPEGSSTDDNGSDDEPRPPWWPEDWDWPPEPEGSTEVLVPPPRHVWPRLPPDHPYHLPPGFWWPDNMPPGHPGTPEPGDEPGGSETSSSGEWV